MNARRWGRKKGDDDTRAPSDDSSSASKDPDSLDDAANAWWTGRGEPEDTGTELDSRRGPKTADEIRESFKRKSRRAEPEAKPHGAFSEYYSADSLFHAVADDSVDSDKFNPDDPYVVLGVPASATWEQIVSAHRRLAKLHHPDRLLDAPPDEQVSSADRMAEINLAYGELRRRRGL